MTGDPLRALWDFDDLEATESRFRELQAEVLTQLARVEGLRGRFAEGEALIAQAEALAGTHPRIDLERGRLLRSGGDPAAAFPLFVRAYENSEGFVKADAAHMCAIATDDPAEVVEWTRRGLAVGDEDPDAAYWAGPLLNNLGRHHFDAGEHEQALDCFERALEARLRDPANAEAIERAREAVAEAKRALEGVGA